MCGVSIVINRNDRNDDEKLIIDSLNSKISNRGPDAEGYYFGTNFAFGHRRLSIIDLSSAGHQPMLRGELCITYNGEVYNYLELKQELEELGHGFVSQSDTEVILAAFQEWGTDAFKKFNGMWAFALHDASKNEIILCRDHFGIKPLYFTTTNSYFLAGSEVKQFTAIDEFIPRLNKAVAVNFLVNGLLNYSEQTFFDGVRELRPGHFLRYNLTTHQYNVTQWYDLESAAARKDVSYPDAVHAVGELFRNSVRIRMRSDVRVGSCLSGGVDSSAIVSVIHKEQIANDDFATVTSCYTDVRYDEQVFSDQVSKQTGFRAIKVFPDLNHLLDMGDLDKMIYHQDQPFSGASHYSEYKVFQAASKEQIIVMQDGQGSDEFLCGYGEFYIAYLKELISSFRWMKAVSVLNEKSRHRKINLLKELLSVGKTIIEPFVVQLLRKILNKKVHPWLSEKWRKIAYDSLLNFEGGGVRELSLKEIQYSSIPYQLHSEDRNSMLFSIESRLPFLDHRLVEYGIGIPSEYKIRNGFTKAVLRDAIGELPECIKRRTDKMGFVAPDPVWMIQNKERVRKDLENVVSSMNIFSNELLNRFDRFTKGELGYEPIYFRAMAFYRFCVIFKIRVD